MGMRPGWATQVPSCPSVTSRSLSVRTLANAACDCQTTIQSQVEAYIHGKTPSMLSARTQATTAGHSVPTGYISNKH